MSDPVETGGGVKLTKQPQRSSTLNPNDATGGGAAAAPEAPKIVLALDFDGCLATAVRYDLITKQYTVIENHPLTQMLIKMSQQGIATKSQIIVTNFSNRQTPQAEEHGHSRKKTGHSNKALAALVAFVNTREIEASRVIITHDNRRMCDLLRGETYTTSTHKLGLALQIIHRYPKGTQFIFVDNEGPMKKIHLERILTAHPCMGEYFNGEDRKTRLLNYLTKHQQFNFMTSLHAFLASYPQCIPEDSRITFQSFCHLNVFLIAEILGEQRDESLSNIQTLIKQYKKEPWATKVPDYHCMGDALDMIIGRGQQQVDPFTLHAAYEEAAQQPSATSTEGRERSIRKINQLTHDKDIQILIANLMPLFTAQQGNSGNPASTARLTGAVASSGATTQPGATGANHRAAGNVGCGGSKCLIS